MIPTDELLKDLTDAQRAAATHVDGPLLIVAGPGSGKTRVITRRVAYLIAQGIPPASILAITFTNKAAGAMKERVSDVLGRRLRDFGKLDQPWPMICTFHSLCLRILRHYSQRTGLAPSGWGLIREMIEEWTMGLPGLAERRLEQLRQQAALLQKAQWRR